MLRVVQVTKLYQTHLIDDFIGVSIEQLKMDTFEQQMKIYNQFIEKELKKHPTILNSDDILCEFTKEIHCAAHTMELSVKDTLKDCASDQSVIEIARTLVKKLRTDSMNNLLTLRNLPKPKIYCATRWGSTHEMTESLLPLKDLCDELSLIDDEFKVKPNFWIDLKHTTKILKFAADAIIKLQRGDLVLSDVYGILLVLKKTIRCLSR